MTDEPVNHWWNDGDRTVARCGEERPAAEVPLPGDALRLEAHRAVTCPACRENISDGEWRDRAEDMEFWDEMGMFLR